jgi:hypothetical protein
MAWEQVASGSSNSFYDASKYDESIEEGSRGKLDMTFSINPPDGQVDAFRSSLEWAGVKDVQVISNGNTISVIFRKAAWWVPVIITAVFVTLAALAVYLVLWKLFKEVPAPVATFSIVAIGFLVLALSYGFFKEKYSGG